MTKAFNPNDGGVQRTTFKLGKYFCEQGWSIYYYSTAMVGHLKPEYGQLFHAQRQGGLQNAQNLQELKLEIESIQPSYVINQMPYDSDLRDNLDRLKLQYGFCLLGCLRNSLFSVKNNIAEVVQELLPPALSCLVNNRLLLWLFLQAHRWKHRRQLLNILSQHDYFVLLTPPNKSELKYFVKHYDESKVVVLPNSIPAVWNCTDEKQKVILHVGRLNIAQKRSDLLIPFWETCYKDLPDWQFIIVGDGPYRQKMVDEIARKKLPRIELVGYQAPESYYRQAQIFVMPSAFEGFPNVLLEAQSYGVVPVAFASYPAVSWIVRDNIDAILVPPFQVKKMAQKVESLVKNNKKRLELGEESLRNAAKFTIDEVGKQWIALFKQLDSN